MLTFFSHFTFNSVKEKVALQKELAVRDSPINELNTIKYYKRNELNKAIKV